uniref:Phosphatidylserine decarboxylase proenzyme 2 n=1 Tax=Tetraselmis sp. GSL018 TaxID=582737 RepID=A0A061QR11_9CHLO|mmetsp:Transcript_22955/g.54920  ORF Transcript_22955/g.54920 Transcript_22955/m.54920 type:complete len:451 (+) Transcript_22955:135-1487(+)
MLQRDEFKMLMTAIGNQFSDSEIDEMFGRVDVNGDGSVSSSELAKYVTRSRQELGLRFLRQCPVTGTDLSGATDFASIVFVHLAMDDGTGESLQGGYKTADQANRSWMLKLSEWVTHPLGGSVGHLYKGNTYRAGGLNVGTAASHILVWDRDDGMIFEETISPHLVLAMRNLYQTPVGRAMLATGAPQIALRELTESKAKYMDSPASVKDIPHFIESFRGRINMDEAEKPLKAYGTFNEFFYRKLKPGSRPVAALDDPGVLVSAADCRLIVFNNVDDAMRLWIKGKNFSIRGLLADTEGTLFPQFDGGSLAVFRLAPQDYHRFHFPVSGTLKSIRPVPGHLYTVNPIAVNSIDVFTENKRAVCVVDTQAFGQVAIVCIGATMVGSIIFTAEEGKTYSKGDELGYFAFGGSTLVAVFPPNTAQFDDDLLQHSEKSLEALVKMGTRIGKSVA